MYSLLLDHCESVLCHGTLRTFSGREIHGSIHPRRQHRHRRSHNGLVNLVLGSLLHFRYPRVQVLAARANAGNCRILWLYLPVLLVRRAGWLEDEVSLVAPGRRHFRVDEAGKGRPLLQTVRWLPFCDVYRAKSSLRFTSLR